MAKDDNNKPMLGATGPTGAAKIRIFKGFMICRGDGTPGKFTNELPPVLTKETIDLLCKAAYGNTVSTTTEFIPKSEQDNNADSEINTSLTTKSDAEVSNLGDIDTQ